MLKKALAKTKLDAGLPRSAKPNNNHDNNNDDFQKIGSQESSIRQAFCHGHWHSRLSNIYHDGCFARIVQCGHTSKWPGYSSITRGRVVQQEEYEKGHHQPGNHPSHTLVLLLVDPKRPPTPE
jgi:hypothetical protein